MMADVFYIERVSNPDLVLFDFVDADGSENPGSLKTQLISVDMGSVPLNPQFFAPEDEPGDLLVKARPSSVDAAITFRVDPATTKDQLFEGMGRLARALAMYDDLRLVRQFDGETKRTYYDILGATELPSLLRGDGTQAWLILKKFTDPTGYPLILRRQPWRTESDIDSALNMLSGSSLLADTNNDGRPDNWAWDDTGGIADEVIDADSMSYQFTIATGSVRKLQRTTGAGTFASGDQVAFAFEIENPSRNDADPVVAYAEILYLDSSNVAVGGNQNDGPTTIPLAALPQVLSKIGAAAGGATDKVRVSIVFDNATSTAKVVRLRKAQIQKASSIVDYRAGEAAVTGDPRDIGGGGMLMFVEGDLRTPVSFAIEAEASSKLIDIEMSDLWDQDQLGYQGLSDFMNYTGWLAANASLNGWTVALENNTANTSGVARVTVAESRIGATLRRVVATRTTKLNSIRGRHRVKVRVDVTTIDSWRVGLKYSLGTADPALISLKMKPLVFDDVSDASGTGYVWLDLGHIVVPEDRDITGIRLELWVERRNGTGEGILNIRDIVLVPDSKRAVLRVPGLAGQEWLGNEMKTPPVGLSGETLQNGQIDGTVVVLNGLNEAAGTPPLDNTGISLPIGDHEVVIEANTGGAWQGNLRFRILEVSTATKVQIAERILTQDGHRTFSKKFKLASLSGKKYQFQVVIKNYSDGEVRVRRMSQKLLPSLSVGERIVTQPTTGQAEKQDTGGGIVSHVTVTGPTPMLMEPGWHYIRFLLGDRPLDGAPGPDADPARDAVVSYSYQIRRSN